MSKRIAIVALVVLIILLAIPLGIGMAMSGCPECPAAGTSHGLCLTLAAMVILFVAMSFMRASAPLTRGYALLLARSLERPPRIV